jgi:hypothetical protein
VDIDFDLRISCANGQSRFESKNIKVNVDSQWFLEIVSLGIIEFIEDDIADMIKNAFQSLLISMTHGAPVCPPITVTAQAVTIEELPADSDSDGVVDADDNCPLDPNPNQEDTNGDDVGDACTLGDLDDDGDADQDDLDTLFADRNESVSESACGMPCDLDGDGIITALDARKLMLLCTRPHCATE